MANKGRNRNRSLPDRNGPLTTLATRKSSLRRPRPGTGHCRVGPRPGSLCGRIAGTATRRRLRSLSIAEPAARAQVCGASGAAAECANGCPLRASTLKSHVTNISHFSLALCSWRTVTLVVNISARTFLAMSDRVRNLALASGRIELDLICPGLVFPYQSIGLVSDVDTCQTITNPAGLIKTLEKNALLRLHCLGPVVHYSKSGGHRRAHIRPSGSFLLAQHDRSCRLDPSELVRATGFRVPETLPLVEARHRKRRRSD